MSKNQTFSQLFNSARTTSSYKVEGVIVEITEQIVKKMESLDVSKTELASRIKASPPYITKLLRGETNFTIESMVKVADALNCDIDVRLIHRTCANDWIELIDKTVETKKEFNVWSQLKIDAQHVQSHRWGLQSVQSPYDETFYHASR